MTHVWGSSFPRELNDIYPTYPTIIHLRILQECTEVCTITWTSVLVGIGGYLYSGQCEYILNEEKQAWILFVIVLAKNFPLTFPSS